MLLGLVVLARWIKDKERQHPQFQVALAAIDCPAPANLSRGEFLDEVAFYAQAPPTLSLLDEKFSEQLSTLFAKHPWVEKVVNVERTPTKRVRVALQFREPVLAVRWKDEWRAVDRHGILLPKKAETKGLPKFEGDAKPPQGPEGTPWGDVLVETMAKKARQKT